MMTSLQITLAGVGVLFIILIVGYNLWQERRYRKEANRMFSSRREDILLGESVKADHAQPSGQPEAAPTGETGAAHGGREEAAIGAVSPQPAEALDQASAEGSLKPQVMDLGTFHPGLHKQDKQEARQPAPAEVTAAPRPIPAPARPAAKESARVVTREAGTTAPEPSAARFEAESPLDQEIEYVARLRFTKPVFVSYNTLMDKLRKLGKAVRGMGRRADGGWDQLSGHPPTTYEVLEFGILLADRGGALTQDQLEKFCRALYDFAAEEGGAVSCPDKHGALEKARDLDLFCVDVDVLLGLNVVARDARPFSGAEIDRLATEAGLKLGMDGAYYLADKDGAPLFSVANQEEHPFRPGGVGVDTHGLSLILDLPRVRDGLDVFDRMTTLGRQMADNLGGRLVDDNGRIVTQDSLQKDRKRLNDYFARMQLRGIQAGGERALRLFA
jgi:FtsZ-interacting cell division protein ZipA